MSLLLLLLLSSSAFISKKLLVRTPSLKQSSKYTFLPVYIWKINRKLTKNCSSIWENCDSVLKNNKTKFQCRCTKILQLHRHHGYHPKHAQCYFDGKIFSPYNREKYCQRSMVERWCWADLFTPHQAWARLTSVPPAEPLCLCLLIKYLFVGISSDKRQRSPLTATTELLSHVLITLMVLGIIDLR